MTDFRSVARRAAQRHGLDPNIFERQIQQESGFNPNAVSPAGARGIAQFMPGTARGLGINPSNPHQALDGAARLMASYVRKFGSYKNALIAYNAGPGRVGQPLPAETQNYVKTILRGSNPRGGGGGGSSPGVGGSSQPGVNAQNGFDPGSGVQGLSALLAAATAPQQTAPPVTLRPAPAFAAAPPMPAGYQGVQSSAPPAPKPTIDPAQLQALTDLTLPKIQQQQSPAPGVPTAPGTPLHDVQRLVERAVQIDREHLPYKWGGGHGPTPAKPGVPVDCSGAVSRLLGVNPRVSGQFERFGQAGRGQHVTIYANAKHVLMEINGHFWGTSGTNPGGGAGWIPREAISPQYLRNFTARHPAGL